MTPMTKYHLFTALGAGYGNNWIIGDDGVSYWLHAVEREDGSGNKFNLTVSVWSADKPTKAEEKFKIFVRTID